MNSMEIEYYIEKYGVIDTAFRLLKDSHIVDMHVAMIKTHEEALKKLLLSQANDE